MGNEVRWRGRRHLPHDIPSWIHGDAIYFVTMCTRPRGQNQLCVDAVAHALLASLCVSEKTARWRLHACVLMPDHLHLLLTGHDPVAVLTPWKRYTARQLGIRWQRGFFEHRLRGNEAISAKVEYLRQNPVRAGLVQTPDAWPYLWVR